MMNLLLTRTGIYQSMALRGPRSIKLIMIQKEESNFLKSLKYSLLQIGLIYKTMPFMIKCLQMQEG